MGIVDGIITNGSPTTFVGTVNPSTSSGRTRLDDDDLFGTGGTNSIYQILEAHDFRTVYGTASMQPGLPICIFWLIEQVKHDHGIRFVVSGYSLPERDILSLWHIGTITIGRATFSIIV